MLAEIGVLEMLLLLVASPTHHIDIGEEIVEGQLVVGVQQRARNRLDPAGSARGLPQHPAREKPLCRAPQGCVVAPDVLLEKRIFAISEAIWLTFGDRVLRILIEQGTRPVTTDTTAPRITTDAISPGARRVYAISIGVSALFVIFQYFTSGEFITDGIPDQTREFWTNLHGYGAYPVMAFALIATIVAFARLRVARRLPAATAVYFVATVVQWLLGHAISTLGIDALTPVHVVVAAIVIGLAVWLSVRSARLRRSIDHQPAVVDRAASRESDTR